LPYPQPPEPEPDLQMTRADRALPSSAADISGDIPKGTGYAAHQPLRERGRDDAIAQTIAAPLVPLRTIVIEQTPGRGRPTEISLAVVVFASMARPGPRLLRPTRNCEINRPPPWRFRRRRGGTRDYSPRLSITVPQASLILAQRISSRTSSFPKP